MVWIFQQQNHFPALQNQWLPHLISSENCEIELYFYEIWLTEAFPKTPRNAPKFQYSFLQLNDLI
jgi:hypothetical protein